jgi:ring-1,2-phenylacetyl-CoA epoxidase subunit PaaC
MNENTKIVYSLNVPMEIGDKPSFDNFCSVVFNENSIHNSPKKKIVRWPLSLKEVNYHCRWSGEWVLRLGDGTAESHTRLATALENLWPYTGELFKGVEYELALDIDPAALYTPWFSAVQSTFEEATLSLAPVASCFMQLGGKTGVHTEELGYILADLQYMQRAYPGCDW